MSISYDDFTKLDLRVAKILKIEMIPGKTKIVKGEIDLGPRFNIFRFCSSIVVKPPTPEPKITPNRSMLGIPS